jgi:hypothetical protein
VTTVLVLVILAAIWAAVLVPPYPQNRRETRPGDSIASFRSQLSVLERTTPGSRSNVSRFDVGRYEVPRYAPNARRSGAAPVALRRAAARRRRRDVFLTLFGAVGVTFVLAVALGGSVWMLHLLVDVLFGAYVLLLISLQQQSVEREEKVRYLAPARSVGRPSADQMLLRRSGS